MSAKPSPGAVKVAGSLFVGDSDFGRAQFVESAAPIIDRAVAEAVKPLVEALHDLTALYETSPGRDPNFVAKARAALAPYRQS